MKDNELRPAEPVPQAPSTPAPLKKRPFFRSDSDSSTGASSVSSVSTVDSDASSGDLNVLIIDIDRTAARLHAERSKGFYFDPHIDKHLDTHGHIYSHKVFNTARRTVDTAVAMTRAFFSVQPVYIETMSAAISGLHSSPTALTLPVLSPYDSSKYSYINDITLPFERWYNQFLGCCLDKKGRPDKKAFLALFEIIAHVDMPKSTFDKCLTIIFDPKSKLRLYERLKAFKSTFTKAEKRFFKVDANKFKTQSRSEVARLIHSLYMNKICPVESYRSEKQKHYQREFKERGKIPSTHRHLQKSTKGPINSIKFTLVDDMAGVLKRSASHVCQLQKEASYPVNMTACLWSHDETEANLAKVIEQLTQMPSAAATVDPGRTSCTPAPATPWRECISKTRTAPSGETLLPPVAL